MYSSPTTVPFSSSVSRQMLMVVLVLMRPQDTAPTDKQQAFFCSFRKLFLKKVLDSLAVRNG
jgi:hypothetical protein